MLSSATDSSRGSRGWEKVRPALWQATCDDTSMMRTIKHQKMMQNGAQWCAPALAARRMQHETGFYVAKGCRTMHAKQSIGSVASYCKRCNTMLHAPARVEIIAKVWQGQELRVV